jgi:hypothetical protein
VQWLPRVEASWLRALEIGEQPQRADTVRGRGSFLAAHNLAVYYRSLGQAAKASYWEHAAADMRHAVKSPGAAELAGSRHDIPALASARVP